MRMGAKCSPNPRVTAPSHSMTPPIRQAVVNPIAPEPTPRRQAGRFHMHAFLSLPSPLRSFQASLVPQLLAESLAPIPNAMRAQTSEVMTGTQSICCGSLYGELYGWQKAPAGLAL